MEPIDILRIKYGHSITRNIYTDKVYKYGDIIIFQNAHYKVLFCSDTFSKGAYCQGYYCRIIKV